MYSFNFNESPISNDVDALMCFGKVRGLLKGASAGLPVAQRGYLVTDEDDDINVIVEDTDFSNVVCRPDAPIGKGNNLPRGRDVEVTEILSFLKEIRKICKDAVLLVLKSPSVEAVGRYIPRYAVDGGAMVIVHKGSNVTYEYVGAGFDVGDITRGKTVHSRVEVPWDLRNDKEASIFWQTKLLGGREDISHAGYVVSRQERINELQNKFNFDEVLLQKHISRQRPSLTLNTFRCLNRVVQPVLHSGVDFGNHYGIMMNIYESHPYVFELWLPSRSSL